MTTKIIAVLLTVISTAAFANTNDSTRKDAFVRVVTGSANGSFKVIYQGEEGQVNFKLVNAKGQIVHDERLRIEKGFIQPINMTQMPSGPYTFMVEDDKGTLEQEVNYISLKDQLLSKISIEQVADQLEFTGTDLASNLKIKIYNDQSELVYTDEITAQNVDQIFDFGRVKSDWVSFVIVSDRKVIADQKFELR